MVRTRIQATMVLGVAALLAAGGFTGCEDRPADGGPRADSPAQPKGDREQLQGTWVGKTVEHRGIKLPGDKAQAFRAVFDGDRVTFAGDGEAEKATIQLNPSAPRKTVVFTDAAGTKRFGIYEMDGGTLRLCVSKPGLTPPAKFESGHELNAVFSRKKD